MIGPILIWVFALTLAWLPPGGIDSWRHHILPAVTLSLFPMGGRLVIHCDDPRPRDCRRDQKSPQTLHSHDGKDSIRAGSNPLRRGPDSGTLGILT